MSIRWLALPALVAAALPADVPASAPPGAMLRSILAAARTRHSVHYERFVGTDTTDLQYAQIADVAVGRGIQLISYRRGTTLGHVTVIVRDHTAYVLGNAAALVGYMGFNAKAAPRYDGVWLRIPSADRVYVGIADGVTLSSTIHDLELGAPLFYLPDSRVAGNRVVVLRGRVKSDPSTSATLYARAKGAPLPVAEVVGDGNPESTLMFSFWDEQFPISVPKNAVPIAGTGLE